MWRKRIICQPEKIFPGSTPPLYKNAQQNGRKPGFSVVFPEMGGGARPYSASRRSRSAAPACTRHGRTCHDAAVPPPAPRCPGPACPRTGVQHRHRPAERRRGAVDSTLTVDADVPVACVVGHACCLAASDGQRGQEEGGTLQCPHFAVKVPRNCVTCAQRTLER